MAPGEESDKNMEGNTVQGALLFNLIGATIFNLLALLAFARWWLKGPKFATEQGFTASFKHYQPASKMDRSRLLINLPTVFGLLQSLAAFIIAQTNGVTIGVLWALVLLAFTLLNLHLLIVETTRLNGRIDNKVLQLNRRKPIVFADIVDIRVLDLAGRKLVKMKTKSGMDRYLETWRVQDRRVYDSLVTIATECAIPGRKLDPIEPRRHAQLVQTMVALEAAFDIEALGNRAVK